MQIGRENSTTYPKAPSEVSLLHRKMCDKLLFTDLTFQPLFLYDRLT